MGVVMGSTVPPLPTAFRVSMYEKLVTDVGVSPAPQTFNWTIDYAIDYSLLSARIAHSAGQYDEICSSIPGHEHTQEPCVEYITPEWRYVHLPGPNICCKCCPSPGFCGVVKPTWARVKQDPGMQRVPDPGHIRQPLVHHRRLGGLGHRCPLPVLGVKARKGPSQADHLRPRHLDPRSRPKVYL